MVAPGGEILSEKLQETKRLTPPLVALRTLDGTLIVKAYRPYLFGVAPRRVLASLRELALFVPHAADRELYASDDLAERRDLAGAEGERVAPLTRRLRELYRVREAGLGTAAAPGEHTLEELRGLGYVQ